MSYERIPLDDFSKAFSGMTELSSIALGGKVVSVSDEFFAEAHNLILLEAPPNLQGTYGSNGELYSGWETRRHNPSYDWCIIKLGTTGKIAGFDVDTTHFDGNEAPIVSVDAISFTGSEAPSPDDADWKEILPKVPIGPSSRHLFKILAPGTSAPTLISTSVLTSAWNTSWTWNWNRTLKSNPSPTSHSMLDVNYVKLKIYPDGGIARFRVYGQVVPRAVFPADPLEPFDVAHVFAGGRVVAVSNEKFGPASNVVLPGRGKNMGDGWETTRSREVAHKDWLIIKLGTQSKLLTAEIDTIDFKGNFPKSFELHALYSTEDVPDTNVKNSPEPNYLSTRCGWARILPRTKLDPDRLVSFLLENTEERLYTHVRVTIYPDGGLKRVRILGIPSCRGSEVKAGDDDDDAGDGSSGQEACDSADWDIVEMHEVNEPCRM
ncbi:allantoicase [Hygrophoropsis aurantiaca]|uniref:Allantoicase n=1 Tax=Hygrophoropsis aurantiaca TaxID=72124 RepID=A0ACB8A6P9_9AGAM|nr:allantoicase [Hygrophoropsis aurantiaca]